MRVSPDPRYTRRHRVLFRPHYGQNRRPSDAAFFVHEHGGRGGTHFHILDASDIGEQLIIDVLAHEDLHIAIDRLFHEGSITERAQTRFDRWLDSTTSLRETRSHHR